MDIYTFDITDAGIPVDRINVPSDSPVDALIVANEHAQAACSLPGVIPLGDALPV